MMCAKTAVLVLLVLAVFPPGASAQSSYEAVYAEFPQDRYLVGIGEISASGNLLKDRRTAEVMARLEIAKQIRVRLREETIDIMCEGGTSRLFNDARECRDEVFMVVETSVDEFLEGSRIVKHGEQKGIFFAVAVIPRQTIGRDLDEKTAHSLGKAKEEIEKAKGGDRKAAENAEKEYMKAVTFDREKEIIEGVRSRSAEVFEELEDELVKLRERR